MTLPYVPREAKLVYSVDSKRVLLAELTDPRDTISTQYSINLNKKYVDMDVLYNIYYIERLDRF